MPQVLIFSQFKIMLDVLEDYLRLKNFPLERIDGSVSQRDREIAIDRYSAGAILNLPMYLIHVVRAIAWDDHTSLSYSCGSMP